MESLCHTPAFFCTMNDRRAPNCSRLLPTLVWKGACVAPPTRCCNSCRFFSPCVSLLVHSFVFFWPKHFPDTPLLYPPNFDARIVSYPSAEVSG